jgi:hypothetical protein
VGQISATLRGGGDHVSFWCPGCEETHTVGVGPNGWTWNRDAARPTFTPSILVTSGHYMPSHQAGDRCWCIFNAERPDNPSSFTCHRCHSFVTGGQIQFLGDSTHALAGTTVPLPELPAFLRDSPEEK